ncbi:hypothetical protein PENFLA_c004G08348 [Penicillium flavigenum]|uniref:Uncharacterized protein n=1 Tax=Penicillium flavigenum TaxID=254877 RepID=A0A1V6TTG2_9EURO|nr:hypothetical protein PENFLA_c004G08348 [Penicillium flavigenum]
MPTPMHNSIQPWLYNQLSVQRQTGTITADEGEAIHENVEPWDVPQFEEGALLLYERIMISNCPFRNILKRRDGGDAGDRETGGGLEKRHDGGTENRQVQTTSLPGEHTKGVTHPDSVYGHFGGSQQDPMLLGEKSPDSPMGEGYKRKEND